MENIEDKIKEAKRLYRNAWRESHKEEVNSYLRQWRKDNKDKVKEYDERYWKKKTMLQNTEKL